MNPAFAFSWFYHLKGADLWEHLIVFWGGCLSGSYVAGLAWRRITKQVSLSQIYISCSAFQMSNVTPWVS